MSTIYTDQTLQDGFEFGGVWSDAVNPLVTGGLGVGFVFNPRPIDQGIPESLILRCTNFAFLGASTLTLAVVPERVPADYDMTHLPGTRSELTLCVISDVSFFSIGDLTFQFGYAWDTSGWVANQTYAANLRTWWGLYGSRADCSRMAISMNSFLSTVEFQDSSTAHPPGIQINEFGHTGHASGGFGRRSKATYCARSGLPLQSDQLVEDGYIKGLWVHPDWYEPEDTTGENINIPGSEREDDGRWGGRG